MLKPEFRERNCKIIGLSTDPIGDHEEWCKDIQDVQGHEVKYPLIGNPELEVGCGVGAPLPDLLSRGAVRDGRRR